MLEDLRFFHIFSAGVVFWLFLSSPDLLQTSKVFDLFSVIVILVVHFVLFFFGFFPQVVCNLCSLKVALHCIFV